MSTSQSEQQTSHDTSGASTPPLNHPHTAPPTSAEATALKKEGDEQASGDIIEPSQEEEDERTALLEHYHNHNSRICGLRHCNHGTFSPRAPSIISTAEGSLADSSMDYQAHHSGLVREPDQPDLAHALLGDPIADALLGTRKGRSKKRLKKDSGERLRYFSYYLPCIRWISQYRWAFLQGDLVAAFTMASFYIPMSLSYASNLGHIPPIHGLYSFVLNPLIYAILGSCPQMVVGPEAPGSLLVGTVVMTCIDHGQSGDDDDQLNAQIAGVVTGIAGAIIFVAGLTRLGFLDSVLSRPFLRGFISAIGVVLFVDQAIPELGLEQQVREVEGVQHGSTITKLTFLINYIHKAHPLTAALSWGAFVVIMVCR